MSVITIQDLQQNPSAWLHRIAAGEHLLIMRDGEPVAELHPVAPSSGVTRPFGLAKGDFQTPDDFDGALLQEVVPVLPPR